MYVGLRLCCSIFSLYSCPCIVFTLPLHDTMIAFGGLFAELTERVHAHTLKHTHKMGLHSFRYYDAILWDLQWYFDVNIYTTLYNIWKILVK